MLAESAATAQSVVIAQFAESAATAQFTESGRGPGGGGPPPAKAR